MVGHFRSSGELKALHCGCVQPPIHRGVCVGLYDTLCVQVSGTIGIQEQALVPLQVYPDPANAQVSLVPGGTWRPGIRYVVLNTLRQALLAGVLPTSGGQPVELSTGSLSAGVCNLRTTLEGKTDAVIRLVVWRQGC